MLCKEKCEVQFTTDMTCNEKTDIENKTVGDCCVYLEELIIEKKRRGDC